MNVMSAWTTNRPGYTQHAEASALPQYDRQFVREQERKLENMLNIDWHQSVEEHTDEC